MDEPLTLAEYRKEVRVLQQALWCDWRELFMRLEITSEEMASLVDRVKWSFIDGMRVFHCAFCKYQQNKDQDVLCKGCPADELCSIRGELPASEIVKRLST